MATQKQTRPILLLSWNSAIFAPPVAPPRARPPARGGALGPAAFPPRADLFQHLVAVESRVPTAPALWARARPPLGPQGAISLLQQREKAVAM